MDSRPNRLSEVFGFIGGLIAAPLFGITSYLREARTFHPEGVCYRATARSVAALPALEPMAQRLLGGGLVRLSGAVWKGGRERHDALGFAVRFGELGMERASLTTPARGDQDLLFVTSRRLWTLPLAFFTTDQHDFLRNDYYALTPFEVEGVGRVELRISPRRVAAEGNSRRARLASAVERGEAVFTLEVSMLDQPDRAWRPVVEIQLTEKADVDQTALRFSPFRDGRGIVPRGFVNAMRPAVYAASQYARPKYSSIEPATVAVHPVPATRPRRLRSTARATSRREKRPEDRPTSTEH
jgi:hypothetical protein